MNVLIIGGSGMLGHKLWQTLGRRFDTWATLRSNQFDLGKYQIFRRDRCITSVDIGDSLAVLNAMALVRPDVVVNCVGVVKQLAAAKDPLPSIAINALFPHQLAAMCAATGARLIHVSTDCVFVGDEGLYVETDTADANDLYGRTKYLGEVGGTRQLTLRTSIIGRELVGATGLVEWFLSNRGGKVRGFQRAIYSGLTTLALAGLIGNLIEKHAELSGVYHVSTVPIDKFALLQLIKEAYGADVEIERDTDFVIDRSLDSTRFRTETGWRPPDWADMIHEMAQDSTPYDSWRDA